MDYSYLLTSVHACMSVCGYVQVSAVAHIGQKRAQDRSMYFYGYVEYLHVCHLTDPDSRHLCSLCFNDNKADDSTV